jgi:SNF2 family DNA or RNA helicase
MIRKFNDDNSTHVFHISTKAGGVGLNITAANRVVIFDFQFNPTCEEQAVGRAIVLDGQSQYLCTD